MAYNEEKQDQKKKVDKKEVQGPGPGQYDVREKLGRHGVSFSKSIRFLKQQADIYPGPGKYEKTPPISKYFSFSKDQRFYNLRKNIPGPGQYTFNQSRFIVSQKQPCFKFPKQVSSSQKSINVYRIYPSPVQYQVQKGWIKMNPIKFKSSKRHQSNQNLLIPSPNTYNIPSSFDQYKRKNRIIKGQHHLQKQIKAQKIYYQKMKRKQQKLERYLAKVQQIKHPKLPSKLYTSLRKTQFLNPHYYPFIGQKMSPIQMQSINLISKKQKRSKNSKKMDKKESLSFLKGKRPEIFILNKNPGVGNYNL